LDPITRREIQREFKTLQRELGKTMIFVTHDIAEAFLLADRLALLQDGAMVLLGRPEDLLRSDHPEARAFSEGFRAAQSSASDA
jgi:osmoprotectant transport system ATP-binding protein